MATYIILNLIMLALAWIVVRPRNIVSRPRMIALVSILLLTLIFDSIMIAMGLFYYNESKLLGIYLGKAPLEDFFYAVMAVLIVPELWQKFAKKEPPA